jgi:RNA 3'-terminal phosphate cyclase (ATP)
MASIRAGRRNPGLMAQHLTSVRAAAEICHAQSAGDRFRSTSLRFEPGRVVSGRYSFDVAEERGSAGSVGLVFQTVLPILFSGSSPSDVEIKGGTHVPFSPPYDYIASVFLPMLGKMGLHARCEIETWGFYPRGGGRMKVRIEPALDITPVELNGRGRLNRITGISAVANLPTSIAERQRDRALKKLRERGLDGDIEIVRAESVGPGSFLFLMAEFELARGGFTALGARGKSSEQVADEAFEKLIHHLESDAALDPHLADQLIIYCALATGRSFFTTSEISNHLLTNKWVVEQFLPQKIAVKGAQGGRGEVEVIGGQYGKKV